jgi:hypothetical protein
MTVYVDDFNIRAQVGTLDRNWSHMMCGPFDDPEELHAFADQIGLARRWYQGPPKHRWPTWHYDVTARKRQQAIANGAVEITWRQAGQMIHLAQTVWHSVNHGGVILCTRGGQKPTVEDRRAVAAALYERAITQDPVLAALGSPA